MVKREIISKASDGITSYMKNNYHYVIMWVCEGMPSALFTRIARGYTKTLYSKQLSTMLFDFQEKSAPWETRRT